MIAAIRWLLKKLGQIFGSGSATDVAPLSRNILDVKYLILRKWYTDNSTEGELYRNGQFVCYTLELSVRKMNKSGRVAIPVGIYPLRITFSNRFQRDMPEICDVPGRSGIRIHVANYPGDVEGCVGVGKERGVDFISHSIAEFMELNKIISEDCQEGRPIIQIINANETTDRLAT